MTAAGTPTGNSPITAYELLWSDNGDQRELFDTLPLPLTKTITGLSEGATYNFAVVAYNVYGAGAASQQAPIRASQVPGAMTGATTVRSGLELVVTFLTPPK